MCWSVFATNSRESPASTRPLHPPHIEIRRLGISRAKILCYFLRFHDEITGAKYVGLFSEDVFDERANVNTYCVRRVRAINKPRAFWHRARVR